MLVDQLLTGTEKAAHLYYIESALCVSFTMSRICYGVPWVAYLPLGSMHSEGTHSSDPLTSLTRERAVTSFRTGPLALGTLSRVTTTKAVMSQLRNRSPAEKEPK